MWCTRMQTRTDSPCFQNIKYTFKIYYTIRTQNYFTFKIYYTSLPPTQPRSSSRLSPRAKWSSSPPPCSFCSSSARRSSFRPSTRARAGRSSFGCIRLHTYTHTHIHTSRTSPSPLQLYCRCGMRDPPLSTEPDTIRDRPMWTGHRVREFIRSDF